MKKNSMLIKLSCSSRNFSSFMNLCVVNNLTLHNVSKIDSNVVEFYVDEKDYKLLGKIDTTRFELKKKSKGIKSALLGLCVKRIGLIVGLIISIILMIFLNNRMLQIHIYGLDRVERGEIVEFLNNKGINVFTLMDFNIQQLEEELANEFNFSLVSIATKGNSLLISIKEELPDMKDSFVPIVADYNMIVKSIDVYAGTPCVNVGEIVYKGDTLVNAFVIKGTEKFAVEPYAKIIGEVFFNESYRFLSKEKIKVQTGQKQIVNINIGIGKWDIYSKNTENRFENFEIKEVSCLVSHYFLPIKLTKVYAYETTEKIIERDFEKEKDFIISDIKQKAYSKVPNTAKIDREEVQITPFDDGYIVNVYLSTQMEWKYLNSN